MILGPNSLFFASLTKAFFTVTRDRSEAENQCFCKALTTVSKIVIFRDFCKGGIERNPQKSAKSRVCAHFGPVLKHLSQRFGSEGVTFRRFCPDSDDFGSKFMNFRVAHQSVLYSGSGPFGS